MCLWSVAQRDVRSWCRAKVRSPCLAYDHGAILSSILDPRALQSVDGTKYRNRRRLASKDARESAECSHTQLAASPPCRG